MAGKVHVELTGALNVSRDFEVQNCAVYMPLDNAYIVNIAPDDVLDSGKVVIPKYKGAGTYAYDAVASKPIYPNFDYQFVDLRLRQGPKLVEPEQAGVTITVDEQGISGSAVLNGYTTDQGGLVSGTITWACSGVDSVVI
jgi:hypothetical protein